MLARLIRPLVGRRVAGTPPEVPVPDGVEVRLGRWVPAFSGWLSGMGHSAAAVTLGRTIVVHPDARLDGRLLRHELEHVRQWRRQPLTFPIRYALCHLRYGYHDNPYERAAREAEGGRD